MNTFDKLIDAWVAVWNSYDLSHLDTLFLNDPSITYLSSEKQGVLTGFESIKQHHEQFGFVPGGKKSENKLWLDGMHTNAFPNAIVAAGIWYFQKPGKPVQKGSVSFMAISTEAGYRFVHLHFANY